jgi:hypothetical protein
MLEYNGDYYTQDQLREKFGITLKKDSSNHDYWDKGGKDITNEVTLREKGELVDFITDELAFSIKSPVTITP